MTMLYLCYTKLLYGLWTITKGFFANRKKKWMSSMTTPFCKISSIFCAVFVWRFHRLIFNGQTLNTCLCRSKWFSSLLFHSTMTMSDWMHSNYWEHKHMTKKQRNVDFEMIGSIHQHSANTEAHICRGIDLFHRISCLRSWSTYSDVSNIHLNSHEFYSQSQQMKTWAGNHCLFKFLMQADRF